MPSPLFSPVNLWKIYKAVEKLGAYEMVRKAPLSPQQAGLPPHPGAAPWSCPGLQTGGWGPRSCPSQRPCMQRGGRGLAWPAGTLLLKASFLFPHLFCLPRARKAAWASSPVAGVGEGVLACRQMSPFNKLNLASLLVGTLPHLVPLQVTGRRLWKNVYDELGGSPGSTSAATCTRRHYERCGRGAVPGQGSCPPGGVVQEWVPESILWTGVGQDDRGVWGGCPATQGSRAGWASRKRWPGSLPCPQSVRGCRRSEGVPAGPGPLVDVPLLLRLVLPYVRHLKGEDDKPLPPSKPRKQYKMAKEPRGDDGATERPKAKEEQLGQVSPEPQGHQVSQGLPACLSDARSPCSPLTVAWPRSALPRTPICWCKFSV